MENQIKEIRQNEKKTGFILKLKDDREIKISNLDAVCISDSFYQADEIHIENSVIKKANPLT